MHLSSTNKRQLLIIIIDCALYAAEKNKLGIGIDQLNELKKSLETESLDQIDKKFKDIFKKLIAQLSIIFGVRIDKKWKENFKFSTKKWKEINNSMDIDVEALNNYVKEQLPFLAVSNDKMIATSSGISEKRTPSRTTGHGRRRSQTYGGDVAIPKPSSIVENQGDVPIVTVLGSTEKRAQYTRIRGISFYRPPQESSSDVGDKQRSSNLPRLKIPEHKANSSNLVDYFSSFFSTAPQSAIQMVIALATDPDPKQFAWGIQVLNAASDKDHTKIAEVLFNNLNTNQLVSVFGELFKLEKQDRWGRGNQLFYTLMQRYFVSEEMVEFKEKLWSILFSLAKPILKIELKKRESMPLHPDGFKAKSQHITQLQEAFETALKQILSSKNFPGFMHQMLRQAYIALMNRTDLKSVDETFMGFLLLRFINPIIFKEASVQLTEERLIDVSKVKTLQIWFGGTLISAIQSLASPISTVIDNKMPTVTGAYVEKELIDEKLDSALFGSITQDPVFRIDVLNIVKEGLQLEQVSVQIPTHNDAQIPTLDVEASIEQLDVLKLEKFSGVIFHSDGSVTPGRFTKPNIIDFFPSIEPQPSTSDSDSELESSSSAATPR